MSLNKFLTLIFACVVFFNTGCSAEKTVKLAPDFNLENLVGENVKLSEQKGNVVLLDFWATWCPPCRASIPKVEELHEKFEGKKFLVIGINLDQNDEAVRAFVKSNGMKYDVLFGNDKVSKNYNIRGIPSFILIDHKGAIIKTYVGYQFGMENEWEKEITVLLKKIQE